MLELLLFALVLILLVAPFAICSQLKRIDHNTRVIAEWIEHNSRAMMPPQQPPKREPAKPPQPLR